MPHLLLRILRNTYPNHFRRSLSSSNKVTLSACRLDNRSLILLQGKESSDFLQGMISNDVRHLQQNDRSSLFAFFLNPSGRIIADAFVYRTSEDTLFIECDNEITPKIKSYLTSHKLRKKLTITSDDRFKVWSLFPDSLEQRNNELKDFSTRESSSTGPSAGIPDADPLIVNDSRLPIQLYRMICTSDRDWSSLEDVVRHQFVQQFAINCDFNVTSQDDYRSFRYHIGVGEGPVDHPVDSALPLESNGDFLNAISFFKGCYVGQELTARSYHTGVIRKRLMPITRQTDGPEWTPGMEFRTKENKLIGKLRGMSGRHGLALLYVDLVKSLNFQFESSDGTIIETHEPFWWPKSIEKEINS